MGEQIGIVTGWGKDFDECLVECAYESRGLAVHQWPLDTVNNWTVTHIASGQSVAKGGETEKQAIKVLEALVSITDWTRQASELRKGVAELGSQVRRVVAVHGMDVTRGNPGPHSISSADGS